jgi:uncharacterized protein YkwD
MPARRIFKGAPRVLVVCLALAMTVVATAAPVAGASAHPKRRRPPPARCANANRPATRASRDAMRAAVVCLINQRRTRRGLPALTVSPRLNSSAQAWTSVMVATGNFSHGPGTAFASRISATGYDWRTAGENIATGYATPSAVVSAWMASPDHCRNILDPSFRNVGTGEVPAAIGGASSDPATWTQDFGLLANQSPLSSNTRPQNGCPY